MRPKWRRVARSLSKMLRSICVSSILSFTSSTTGADAEFVFAIIIAWLCNAKPKTLAFRIGSLCSVLARVSGNEKAKRWSRFEDEESILYIALQFSKNFAC